VNNQTLKQNIYPLKILYKIIIKASTTFVFCLLLAIQACDLQTKVATPAVEFSLYRTLVKSQSYINETSKISQSAMEELNADTSVVSLFHPYENQRRIISSQGIISKSEITALKYDLDFHIIRDYLVRGDSYISDVSSLYEGSFKNTLISQEAGYVAFYPFKNKYGATTGYLSVRWLKNSKRPSDFEIEELLRAYSDQLTELTVDAENNYI